MGALLQLGRCFDLMDTRFTSDLGAAYPLYVSALSEEGATLPENKGGTPDKLLRYRDCAVLYWYLEAAESRADRREESRLHPGYFPAIIGELGR